MIQQRNYAYINEKLFFKYISNVFIPYAANLGARPQFENETGILMMNSALPPVSDRVLRLLCENKIMTIVCPAHTTNIFLALDRIFFPALKKLKRIGTGEFDDS
jgi:hypothetical protein